MEKSNPNDSSLVLKVIDSGIGIEPERLSALFEPFEQAHRGDAAIGGLGLGLSICKGVIEAHQGRIRAHSAGAGRGATFEIVLPVLGLAVSD